MTLSRRRLAAAIWIGIILQVVGWLVDFHGPLMHLGMHIALTAGVVYACIARKK